MSYILLLFAHYIAFGASGPYLPLFLRRGAGLDQSEIGWVLALSGLTWLAGPFVWGPLADRTGHRRLMLVAGLAAAALLYPLYLLVGSFAAAIALSLAFNAVFTSITPMFDDLILRHLRTTGGEYGRIRLWGSFSFIAGSMAIGILLDHGLAWTQFALFSAAEIATAIIVLSIPRETIDYRAERPRDLHFWRALSGPFIGFLAAAFIGRLANAGHYTFFSLFLDSIGVSDTMKGVAWAVGVIAEIGMMFVAGGIVRKIGAYRLFLLGLVGTAFRYALYAVWPTMTGAMVGQLLHSLSFGAFYIGSVTVIAELSPPGRTATGQLAFAAICTGLGGAIGNPISGYVADEWGYRAMYLVSAGFATLAAAVATAVMRRAERAAAMSAEVPVRA